MLLECGMAHKMVSECQTMYNTNSKFCSFDMQKNSSQIEHGALQTQQWNNQINI